MRNWLAYFYFVLALLFSVGVAIIIHFLFEGNNILQSAEDVIVTTFTGQNESASILNESAQELTTEDGAESYENSIDEIEENDNEIPSGETRLIRYTLKHTENTLSRPQLIRPVRRPRYKPVIDAEYGDDDISYEAEDEDEDEDYDNDDDIINSEEEYDLPLALPEDMVEERIMQSNSDCDVGHVEYVNGEKYCCRGYRADSNDWPGYRGEKCCPEGTSVNGFGQCIPCGVDRYYNMGYADLQHKHQGTSACGQRCRTNEDCPYDRFCYMDAHATAAYSSIDPVIGTCVLPHDVGGVVAHEVLVDGRSAGYWIGLKNSLDWWSARNFCRRYAKRDLPTRQQICGADVEPTTSCPSLLRIALEDTIGIHQQAPHFWLEATDSGKAYYVDPRSWGYVVKIPPEITARTRSAGVVCGPVDPDDLPSWLLDQVVEVAEPAKDDSFYSFSP